jgi:imidazolonepropionase-like amidohydrolase
VEEIPMSDSTLIAGAQVFDGGGGPAGAADVLIEGNRIAAVGSTIPPSLRRDAEVIDGSGATLIPGLIDGHAHLGFGSTVEHVSDRRETDEEKGLLVAHSGRVLLDCGFTGAYSGGNRLPRAEVAARSAFAQGWLPGPRLRAASWEGSAGLVEPGVYDFPGTGGRASDPGSVARFVAEMADIGVDIVKLNLSGESAIVAGSSRIVQFTDEEVAAASATAAERGVWLTAHAHSADAIKMAVRHGVRAIYHCTFPDEEALDLLAAARDRVFVAPTPGIIYAHLIDPAFPPADITDMRDAMASIKQVVPELKARGVRLVPGGDYGFAFNPIGKNARDLQLFVDWFGLTAAEALRSATEVGGQLMDMSGELGLIRQGYLADLLLVEGDPVEDISILQDQAMLAAIIKDGRIHKLADGRRNRRRVLAVR